MVAGTVICSVGGARLVENFKMVVRSMALPPSSPPFHRSATFCQSCHCYFLKPRDSSLGCELEQQLVRHPRNPEFAHKRSSDVIVAIRRIANHVIRAIHQSQVQSNLVETGDAECVDIVSRVSHRNLARNDFHCRLGNFWAWWRKNNTSDYKQMERPAKVQERLAPTRPKTKNEKAE